jgi:CRISPR/Cas system-associated exonuclease Cas4 (RecB family)
MSKNWEIKTPSDIIATDNYYLIKGKKYLRVTRVLSIIDKPELRNWYAKTGNVKAKEILHKRAGFGTTSHKLIEVLLKEGKIDVINYDEQYVEMLNIFEEWKDTVEIDVESTEQKLWSNEFNYAGTCDCIANINGKKYICDWKTSKSIYPEYILQLSAYYIAFKELTGIELDGALILQMRDKKYKEQYFTKEELMEAFEIFLAAKKIFEWKYKEE